MAEPKKAVIQIAGDSIVVTASTKLADLLLITKNRPSALRIKDDDGNDIFAVSVGSNSISPELVSFATVARGASGLANVTLKIPDDVEDVEGYIVDTYGGAITNLNKIEATLSDVIADINKERKTVRDSIVTLDAPGSSADEE